MLKTFIQVESLLDELGLRNIEHSYIGSQFSRGISGGERKRVAIAIELVTGRSILMLDERMCNYFLLFVVITQY